MTALLKIDGFKNTEPALAQAQHRAHYEQVAYDILRVIWSRKWLIAAMICAALVLAFAVLLLMRPRYTGEAIIVPNFKVEEPAIRANNQPAAASSQPAAVTDTASLVDSAARIVRSRPIASAVVTRLGLDKDPNFARPMALLGMLTMARSKLGLTQPPTPSAHDLAVNELMRRITVTNEPRSYLITVAVSGDDPDWAAKLANSIALEYLRTQMVQRLTDAEAAAERNLVGLSSIFGARHPDYLSSQTRLQEIKARLTAVREGSPSEDVLRTLVGESLIPAETVVIPSSPNILLVIGISLGAALLLGVWLALLLERRRTKVDRTAAAGSGATGASALEGTTGGLL